MSHTQSQISGETLLRWMGRAALVGLLVGLVVGIAAL
jgi:hypothetical protein